MSRYVLTITEQIKLQRICKAFRTLFISLYTEPSKTYEEEGLMYQLTEYKTFFNEFCGEHRKRYEPKNNITKQVQKLSYRISEFRLKLNTLSRDQRYVNDTLRDLQNALLDYTHATRNRL